MVNVWIIIFLLIYCLPIKNCKYYGPVNDSTKTPRYYYSRKRTNSNNARVVIATSFRPIFLLLLVLFPKIDLIIFINSCTIILCNFSCRSNVLLENKYHYDSRFVLTIIFDLFIYRTRPLCSRQLN